MDRLYYRMVCFASFLRRYEKKKELLTKLCDFLIQVPIL